MSGTVVVFLVAFVIATLAQQSKPSDEDQILKDNKTVRANTNIVFGNRSCIPIGFSIHRLILLFQGFTGFKPKGTEKCIVYRNTPEIQVK